MGTLLALLKTDELSFFFCSLPVLCLFNKLEVESRLRFVGEKIPLFLYNLKNSKQLSQDILLPPLTHMIMLIQKKCVDALLKSMICFLLLGKEESSSL